MSEKPTSPVLAEAGHPGVRVLTVRCGAVGEAYITIPAQAGDEPASLFQRLYSYIDEAPEWRVIRQDVFGTVRVPEKGMKSYRLDGAEWPATWVEAGHGQASPLAGVHAHALSGVRVHPLRLNQRLVGVWYEDEYARHAILTGIRPTSPNGSRPAQAQEALLMMEQGLAMAGMTFRDVYRTWFYLEDILEWYGEFNVVRNRFFKERGIYEGLVPASTGVGGVNSGGTALVADLMAVVPKSKAMTVRAVPSPLQCPALEYGSSFSRAVETSVPGQRKLTISGTASIAPEGHTIHVGDVRKQIELTMDVVLAILRSRGMDWKDTTRAIGYFRHAADMPLFAEYCAANKLPDMPAVISLNDVCRDDLLFELELDATVLG